MYNTHRPLRQLHFPYLLGLRARENLRSVVVHNGHFLSSNCSGPAVLEYQVISFRYGNINVFLYIRTMGGNEKIILVYSYIRVTLDLFLVDTYCTYKYH